MNKLPRKVEDMDSVANLDTTAFKRKKCNVVKEEVSEELMNLVIRALKTGLCDKNTAAATFNLSYPTITKIYKEFISPTETEEDDSVGGLYKLQKEHVQFILESLAENCKHTFKDMRQMLKNKFGIDVSSTKIAGSIPVFHFSFIRLEDSTLTTITPEIITDHKEYCELFLQLKDSGRLLIFFDETEFEITMRRFSEKHSQLIVPHLAHNQNEVANGRLLGRQPTLVPPPSTRIRHKAIMASLTLDELIYYKAFDGPRSRHRMMEYLNGLCDVLLNRGITGAVFIMGNTAFNYCQEITEIIQFAGHEVVFLPACNSFLNPVENMFSHWTKFIRAHNPKSEKELENLIGSFYGIISNDQCALYYNHVIDNATGCATGRIVYSE